MSPGGSRLRVAATSHDFRYVRELYRPLVNDVELVGWPVEVWYEPDRFASKLSEFDVLHVHWPEFSFGLSAPKAESTVAMLREAGMPIVWTAHDSVPHLYESGYRSEMYATWLRATSGLIHHSEWGRAELARRYEFDPAAEHRVIYHPPWRKKLVSKGAGAAPRPRLDLAFPPVACVLASMAARDRRRTFRSFAFDAFAATNRPDMQLITTSLEDETVPDDPRITAWPFVWLGLTDFKLLMEAIDVFLFPFRAGESTLTTGLPADAIAQGKPMLASDFAYLAEVLGDAPIVYGSSREELTACLNALDGARLSAAAARSHALGKRYTWDIAAVQTLELLTTVHARS